MMCNDSCRESSFTFDIDPAEKPDPPIQVEAHDPTSKSITVTWKAPDYDGGCPIQGYIVEKIEKEGDRYERVTPSLIPGFSHVVTGLKEGMEYQFRVRAENAAGVSEPSRSTPLTKAADPVGAETTTNNCGFRFSSEAQFQNSSLICRKTNGHPPRPGTVRPVH